jgi:hypothetical protein
LADSRCQAAERKRRGDYLLNFLVPRVVTENIMRHGFAPDGSRRIPEFAEPFGHLLHSDES